MPKIVTPADRKRKIAEAQLALGTAALDALRTNNPADWAKVEEHGATIHRNARILAGKSRGG